MRNPPESGTKRFQIAGGYSGDRCPIHREIAIADNSAAGFTESWI
jgi:hypothetical protein